MKRERLLHSALMALSALILGLASTGTAQAGFDGVYRGKVQMVESTQGEFLAPATLVVMPDLKSAIMTTTFPWRKTGALSTAIRGTMSGRTFTGVSKGKFQTGAYHYAVRWTIRFNNGTAAVEADALNRPSWGQGSTKTMIFRKVQ